MVNINIVDLAYESEDASKIDIEQLKCIGAEIAESFENTGFVYIKNHGIAEKVIQDAFNTSIKFFDLEDDVKNEVAKGPKFQGYVTAGREKLDQSKFEARNKILSHSDNLHIKESYDVRTLTPEGMFPDKHSPQLRHRLLYYTPCLTTIPSLYQNNKSVITFWVDEACHTVDKSALQQAAFYVDNMNGFRISLYYPPINDDMLKTSPKMVRCGEHTDFGLITLLCQDPTGGPEVQTNDKEWIYADYKPGCILVNSGDLLEIISDGRFPATNHRVSVPQDPKLRGMKRQSLAFFVHSDDDVPIEPLSGAESKYAATTSISWAMDKFMRTVGHTYGKIL